MSHALFDAVKKEKRIAYDVQLSAQLGLSRAQINRYRNCHDKITPALILRIYDFTGFSIEKIRELAADTVTPAAPLVRPPKPAKPAKVSRPWHAVAGKPAKAAAPKVVAPVVPAALSRVTITDTPKWVSRVHRIM